jgi:hypothetical protein
VISFFNVSAKIRILSGRLKTEKRENSTKKHQTKVFFSTDYSVSFGWINNVNTIFQQTLFQTDKLFTFFGLFVVNCGRNSWKFTKPRGRGGGKLK